MSILANIFVYGIMYNPSNPTSMASYFLIACLIASFVRDRIEQFINKLFTFFLLNITAWTVKKQRSKKALIAIIINLIFLIPFGIVLLALASFLSAPLLPLFTFPIFLIGFPRTKRFWPQRKPFFSFTTNSSSKNNNSIKNQVNSSDSSFYEQLVPQLLPSFRELIKSGSIGNSIQPDTYFLSRFQDRIIWLQIMESSNSYYIINIKGLELQETSCHTRESQYIDDCFDLAFENTNGAYSNSSSSKKCCILNPSPLNCMKSCDLLIFNAYSDAKNNLVGILDNPETINQISLFYPKVLHYFLIKFLLNRKIKINSNEIDKNQLKKLFKAHIDTDKNTMNITVENDDQQKVINILKQNDNTKNLKANRLPSIQSNSPEKEPKVYEKNEKFLDNTKEDWSDSSDSDLDEKKKATKKKETNKKNIYQNNEENPFDFDLSEILGSSTSSSKNNKNKKIDINIENSNRSDYNVFKSELENQSKTKIISETIPETSSYIDENISLLTIPSEWTQFFNNNLNSSQAQMNESKIMKTSIMSSKWTELLLDLIEELKFTNLKSKHKELLIDYENGLNVSYFIFILKCCSTIGLNENKVSSNLNPFSIQKFYAGELPFSTVNEKLSQDFKTLQNILIKAFQYTIKMTIDHATICPITDDTEFIEALKTYEEEWYIGTENEIDYAKSILKNKEYLFSLYKDQQKVNLLLFRLK
jgi:hypothetical protein